MFCRKCGMDNPEGARYCRRCGEALERPRTSSEGALSGAAPLGAGPSGTASSGAASSVPPMSRNISIEESAAGISSYWDVGIFWIQFIIFDSVCWLDHCAGICLWRNFKR